jgi:hypothetical protein
MGVVTAQHPLQLGTSAAQQPNSDRHGPRRLQHLGAVTVQAKRWLTMAQLAEHAPFPSAEAARKFVTRNPALPRGRVGRCLRVDRDTFDRFIAETVVSPRKRLAS